MSRTYLPYDPDQQLLLPTALQEWLPEDHLANFLPNMVEQLDFTGITDWHEQESSGPPHHPRMTVTVLLHGHCAGVASSRRIAQMLHEGFAFRALKANNTPDFRTSAGFRRDHLKALSRLFI